MNIIIEVISALYEKIRDPLLNDLDLAKSRAYMAHVSMPQLVDFGDTFNSNVVAGKRLICLFGGSEIIEAAEEMVAHSSNPVDAVILCAHNGDGTQVLVDGAEYIDGVAKGAVRYPINITTLFKYGLVVNGVTLLDRWTAMTAEQKAIFDPYMGLSGQYRRVYV